MTVSPPLRPPPRSFVRPAALPVVALADVRGLRACCVACHGQMVVEPPDTGAGRVACLQCDREMAEVREQLPTPWTPDPGIHPDDLCKDCGKRARVRGRRCPACAMRAWRASKRVGVTHGR